MAEDDKPMQTNGENASAPSGGGYISQARLVIGLALFFGAGLAAVHVLLSPLIAANKENETLDAIPTLVPGAERDKSEPLQVEDANGKQQRVYRARKADDTLAGWVVIASGQGFVDKIELLIGLAPTGDAVTGLFVLSQKETPGLGNYITSPEKFTHQFRGAPADPPLVVKKNNRTEPYHIKPLTAATISSESVCDIVNAAVAGLGERLKELAAAPSASTSSGTPSATPGTEAGGKQDR